MKTTISVEEAIMLEAYKKMREVSKKEDLSNKSKAYIASKVFFKSLDIIDQLEKC